MSPRSIHGLGRRFAPDSRDLLHPMAAMLPGPTAPLPTNKRWNFRGAVLDQGSTQTCTAHAAAHFYRAEPIQHRRDINPYDLYREGVLLDEWKQNDIEATYPDSKLQWGSSGRGMVKALEARGLIQEYRWASTLREATEWVLTRGPVLIGTNWYHDFEQPTREGFVTFKSQKGGGVAGGHETLLRGVDTTKGIALVVNSWGPGWNSGKAKKCPKGHFLISFEDLERLFHEDGDAVSPIEKKPPKKKPK